MKKYSKGFLWRQRIGFGISDYACSLAYLMVNTYLLIFYTDVVGISAGAAAFMFIITKFVDAGTDYLVGALIDRTNTKMGRSRPWMLAGTPVLAIGMVLVFTSPDWSAGGKLVWAYVTYIIFSFGYTLANIPMTSIIPTLSADPVERTKIVTSRTIFANIGSLTSASMALWLVDRLGHGNQALGYRNTNIVFGVIVAVIMLISVASIREINPAAPSEKTGIFSDFKYLIRNKPYMLMVAYTFTFFLGYLGTAASITYYFKYIIGNEMLTSTANTIMILFPIVAMLIAVKITAVIPKRNIALFGTAIQIVGYVLVWFAGEVLPLAWCGLAIIGLGYGFRQNTFFTMLADTVDYGEWKNGKNLSGTQTAVAGLANKVSSAAATGYVGLLLAMGGYNGAVMVQVPSANRAIILSFIAVPVLCNVLSVIILAFYDLDKNYKEIKNEIEQRRAGIIADASESVQ